MGSILLKIQEKVSLYFSVYTPEVFILWATGFVLWVSTYLIIIVRLKKYKKLEIPPLAIPLNLAWELMWSLPLQSPLGKLYSVGSSIWFFLDLLIIFYALKKFLSTKICNSLKDTIVTYGSLFFIMTLFSYYTNKYQKDELGFFSAYPLNVLLSYLFIIRMAKNRTTNPSILVAWAKGLGSFFISLGGYIYYGTTYKWLVVAFLFTLLLDTIYILFVYQKIVKINAFQLALYSLHQLISGNMSNQFRKLKLLDKNRL